MRSDTFVTALAPDDLSDADSNHWIDLYRSQAEPSNPFLHPIWVDSWYAAYTQKDQRLLLLVHTPGRQLIGVMPLYRQVLKLAGVTLGSRLVPVGAGAAPTALELPGFLAARGMARDVGRALVAALFDRTGVDWSEITI